MKKIIKKGLIIAGILFIAFLVLVIAMAVTDDGSAAEESMQKHQKADNNKKIENLSDLDLEKFVEKSGKDLEKIGFTYDKEYMEYTALEGKVYITCDDLGKVDMVMIEETSGKEPLFHGVQIGMTEAQASKRLEKDYPLKDKSEEGIAFVNVSTGSMILCNIEEDRVIRITYMVMTEEELKEIKAVQSEQSEQKEYIFPNSNSKYLSEDEVRSAGADKLFIGRNEIFARHGYIFEDEGLKKHFGSTSWYQGTIQGGQFSADAVFNDFEKKNVELIKKIEDELNGVQKQFVGLAGTYICTTPDMDGLTGKIEILGVGSNTIQYSLGALDMPSAIVSGEAQVTSSNTAQAELYDFTFTLTWSDAENMYVTNSGELRGMDSGTIMSITNGMGYTRPLEFNQR